MQIKNIFQKDLFRPINGVVKVGDESASTVWQELDEYVITRELAQHFHKFFTTYLEAVDNPKSTDVRNRTGVWVSGFFGSGKSHFIKIISYLLKNETVTSPTTGKTARAIDFFKSRIDDNLFYGDIKRAVENPADVLLFNIDSKSDDSKSRDAILKVFMQVLNELQGYCSSYPYLADVERQLEKDGKYESFRAAFEKINGSKWQDERDSFLLRRDDTIAALCEATGISPEAAGKLIDGEPSNYSLSVEKFANKVKEYLDSKGKNHRLLFVADEVGQFIGTDTHLMLNLQTIVEDLGKACDGRAWVVVTSQEDIDKVLGDVVGAKSNDFSKIQGRFTTRISLSSSNTDEVIQARLLEKKVDAESELHKLFGEKGDVLKNQLSFSNNGATLKNFKDENDFSINYPFAPYHYQIVQAVFESIRKAGATGLHLARGERSMLDAFQQGAQSIAKNEIGSLVPFYSFYSSVESFLDTAVAKTIKQAGENESLTPFDVDALKLLFLIRYVEILKPNLDNLVTLCITKVDDDRITLKHQLEESLARLEKQTLINRNGDLYFFLTNEERDIGREIKNLDLSADQQAAELSKFLFTDILAETAKHRYSVNKNDFEFNRFADSRPFKGIISNELNLEIVTPLNFDFESYTSQKCVLDSSERVLIKLPANENLKTEIATFLRTQRYIQQKNDASAPQNTRRILREKAEENQQRHQRIIDLLKLMLDDADVYAVGQQLSGEKKVTVNDAQTYLIKNLYSKLGYLNAPADDPVEEIKAILLANDIGQQTLNLDSGQPNATASKELQSHIDLRANNNVRITLEEVALFFERKPFGWKGLDTVLLVARLFTAGELTVKIDGAASEPRQAVEWFSKRGKWKQVGILKRRTTTTTDLANAAKLAHQVFGKMSDGTKEDGLAKFIRGEIGTWQDKLKNFRAVAESGDFPGFDRIKATLDLTNMQVVIADTYEFFRRFNEDADLWNVARDDYSKLFDFYHGQIDIWRNARTKLGGSYKDNRSQLDLDTRSRDALQRIEEIFKATEPYQLIQEITDLLAEVDSVNQQILANRRNQGINSIDAKIIQLKSELDAVKADSDTRNSILTPFQTAKAVIEKEESIQRIAYQEGEHAEDMFQNALEAIENKRAKPDGVAVVSARPTRSIRPATLSTKPYIETKEELDEFLAKLRSEMEEALKENARIRIQ